MLYKAPGTLQKQMFKIERCNDSHIYVHDFHSQASVALCDNSVIVMGPCSSSTFVRNCNDCTLVICCQ